MINDAIVSLKDITEQGHAIYQCYLKHGKTFFYAKQLFANNLLKLNVLEVIIQSQQIEYVKASKLLIEHIKSWQEQWIELQIKSDPSDNDEFVFISRTPYPKEAELIFN
ncbi:hypothetical protein AAEU29_19590 [Pseudoalteromonas sp. SSM20]|uniref:hypothetical protein n=1 Tax=Pseudoalteromonas sp. SSM20 TaxID=3139394 RepID=UPI003BA8B7F9